MKQKTSCHVCFPWYNIFSASEWNSLEVGTAVLSTELTKPACHFSVLTDDLVASDFPQNSRGKYHQPSEPVTVSVSAAIHPACRAVCQCREWDTLWLQQYGPHFDASLNSSETLRLTRISRVYTTERAQVAEGQDSKWPDESVTLGKFHPRVGGGSKMSAGSSVLIAGCLR